MTDSPKSSDASNSYAPRCVIVVPCLNESKHIGGLLTALLPSARALGCDIVVADGGSTDGTQAIVAERASDDPGIRLVGNPRRVQSAAVNDVVEALSDTVEFVIRVDAHGGYPADYCEVLLAEAERTGADSVVVSMQTKGLGRFQSAVADAQNSRLGTGGSSHRMGATGSWVDHGHHALMRVSAFRAVNGYDETFSHNEDAELDYRLGRAGLRIWMTDRTHMIYYPRDNARALFRQYFGYGKGRAKNVLKHRTVPKVRQSLPLLVAPAFVLALLAVVHWIFAVPLLIWACACLSLGVLDGLKRGSANGVLVGFAAMVMHLAWSVGFWAYVLQRVVPRSLAYPKRLSA